ncbi:MAG: PIG-L family deacetylase [Eubacterium sp.]|nr:PIG-L family deacetylase [Eubacterium sp.]
MKKVISVVLCLALTFSIFSFASFSEIDAYAWTKTSKSGGFTVEALNLVYPKTLKRRATFMLSGTIKSKQRITKICFVVSDLDRFKNEISVTKKSNRNSLNIKTYSRFLHFEKLSSGEKNLKITAFNAHGESVSFNKRFTVLGKASEPYHITGKCYITADVGDIENVIDSSDDTFWNSGTMTIIFPEDKEADGVLIKWYKPNCNYTIKTYDDEDNVLDEYDGDGFSFLHKYIHISGNAVKAVIDLNNTGSNNGISSLRVYQKDKVGVSVQRWEEPEEGKCDLMVVSAHRDDELLFFGGTIPYYSSVRGKNVYTVFVSGGDIMRHREALASQWSMGVKTYPVFLNYPGGYHDGINGTLKDFGGENAVLERFVETIRKYQPEVIVSHDVNGEYGHPTHKTVAYIIQKAVRAAGDETRFESSYQKYGAWKVKKLYLHMYGKNKIKLNYNNASAKLDGRTPYQMACVGYDKYYSQHKNWQMNATKVTKYPSNQYGLAFTIVGKDEKKNDFFEHINPKENNNYD